MPTESPFVYHVARYHRPPYHPHGHITLAYPMLNPGYTVSSRACEHTSISHLFPHPLPILERIWTRPSQESTGMEMRSSCKRILSAKWGSGGWRGGGGKHGCRTSRVHSNKLDRGARTRSEGTVRRGKGGANSIGASSYLRRRLYYSFPFRISSFSSA